MHPASPRSDLSHVVRFENQDRFYVSACVRTKSTGEPADREQINTLSPKRTRADQPQFPLPFPLFPQVVVVSSNRVVVVSLIRVVVVATMVVAVTVVAVVGGVVVVVVAGIVGIGLVVDVGVDVVGPDEVLEVDG